MLLTHNKLIRKQRATINLAKIIYLRATQENGLTNISRDLALGIYIELTSINTKSTSSCGYEFRERTNHGRGILNPLYRDKQRKASQNMSSFLPPCGAGRYAVSVSVLDGLNKDNPT